jgi:hypothetical protein
MGKERIEECELCGSKEDLLNFHHLIPRTLHHNKYFKKLYSILYMATHGIWICQHECHKQIHVFIDEKEMGIKYNTLEKLLEHQKVSKFVEWRKKKIKSNN